MSPLDIIAKVFFLLEFFTKKNGQNEGYMSSIGPLLQRNDEWE